MPWREFDGVIRRYLASKLFAGWWPYLGLDLRGVVEAIARARGRCCARRLRATDRPARHGPRRSCFHAIRDTDLLMVHLSDSRALARLIAATPMTTSVLDRFLRYVTIDTRADERSRTVPTTPGQLTLLRLLVDELQALGIADAAMDEHGYVMATVPADDRPADVPVIGFLAHVDTSPEMPGQDVVPIVHRHYDGRDIVLPDDPSAVLRAADNPALAAQDRRRHRHRVGPDAARRRRQGRRGRDHGGGRVPRPASRDRARRDPRSASHRMKRSAAARIISTSRRSAPCAPTRSTAAARGELEYESFSADAITVTFKGFNTHPGYAKGRMVNAIKLAADFIARLPAGALSPETTDGYDGYVHPYQIDASVDRTSVRLLVRDFVTAGLKEKEALVERLAREVVAGEPRASVEIAVEESYRNMREVLDRHPDVIERAREAIRRAGLEPIERPIRGGTDGSRLSFMGLPTPNLFTGEHNFHSRLEWTSRQELEKAVEVIVELSRSGGRQLGADARTLRRSCP